MRILLPTNVWDSARARFRWLYEEFEHVLVSYSGGKDSTVVLELAVLAAREAGRLPVEVLFIDQEAEWTSTVEMAREVNARPDVKLYWLQCPIQIFNATSQADPWLWCWEDGREHLREREPDSIRENTFGTTRLHPLFGAFGESLYGTEPAAHVTGVRAEESPSRLAGLTTWPCYKHVTWGSKPHRPKVPHPTFHPIYDWSYIDVWKAIHDNGWSYNELYDLQYQHGSPVRQMRVSNLHHETAVHHLEYVHDVDGDLWNRLTARLQGVNSAKQMESSFRRPPDELPPMFRDWQEYRDYLLEHLIEDPEIRETFRRQFKNQDGLFYDVNGLHVKMWKMHVGCILANDYHGTKMSTFVASQGKYLKGQGKLRGKDFYNNPGKVQA